MKNTFQLNHDENIRFDEIRNVWVVELMKNDYLDGIERWIEVGEFSSKGRAESALKNLGNNYYNNMYRIYFLNFCYHSANAASNIKDAKDIARKAGFDSIIELNGEAVCTYSAVYGFMDIYPPEIKLYQAG